MAQWRTSSGASSSRRPARRRPRREWQDLAPSRPSYDVEIVPGRVLSARPVRFRNGQPMARDPDWPHLADVLRAEPGGAAHLRVPIRAACARATTVTVLAHADPRARRPPAGHRRRAAAAPRGARRRRRRRRAGAVLLLFKSLGAHMLGYVAEIDSETLARCPRLRVTCRAISSARTPLGYEAGDTIGATGIERRSPTWCAGSGWEKRVVDARGGTGQASRPSASSTRPTAWSRSRARPATLRRRGARAGDRTGDVAPRGGCRGGRRRADGPAARPLLEARLRPEHLFGGALASARPSYFADPFGRSSTRR